MVICFVFGCNHSSQKKCCSFLSFPSQDRTRREALKWFYSTGFGAGGNQPHSVRQLDTYAMRCNNSAMSECIYKGYGRRTSTTVTSH